ncbi:phage shock protein C [Vibrio astriarenae]|nr:phage shock protein C [Vibrio sp. C7]
MRKELYRDPINGKLTGVCAGLANYFSVEVWLVRIIAITFALLGGAFLVVVAYVAMTLMIEKQPKGYQTQWKINEIIHSRVKCGSRGERL